MTYIEFFDKTALENVCACLTRTPQRVIFIGDNERLMRKNINYYARVFEDRGQSIEFLCETVDKNNLTKVLELLNRIVNTYEECVFDITGGTEILILALGIVRAEHPEKNIQIRRVNLRNNRVYDYDEEGNDAFYATPVLSVEENVRIYGGDVVYESTKEGKTYRWDMNEEFLLDIEKIWQVCKGNVRLWNTQIGVLEAVEACRLPEEDQRFTNARMSAVEQYLARRKSSYKIIRGIIHYLLEEGLLLYYDDSDGRNIQIVYKNLQVKRILTKAGQALEMKIFAAAQALKDKDGTPVYNDVLNGVVIDWDGALHNAATDGVFDTENEIDILMMHDMVPVFVSCKNGFFDADELYKLHTVAQRFGGEYAKKVLVATALSATGEAAQYLRQRAQDMNILLIEDVQDMPDTQLAKKLRNWWVG